MVVAALLRLSYNPKFNFMKVVVPPAKRFALATIAALLLLSFSAAAQTPVNSDRKPERPLNLLVLGDSISWGQGLKDEHKAWYLIKSWLRQTTGREVRETVEAHSGALIGSPEDSRGNSSTEVDGELSRAYPTVNGQLDIAVKAFGDPSQVDLVLLNGCINDLDSRRLLNAANTPDKIRELAQEKCGPPMETLLMRITTAFPKANVIVTGYYPILSEKTANDLFIRALARRFYTPEPGAPKVKDEVLRARLIAISHEWYQTSDHAVENKRRAPKSTRSSLRRYFETSEDRDAKREGGQRRSPDALPARGRWPPKSQRGSDVRGRRWQALKEADD